MSRRISLGVAAAGATLLFALTGCAAQQQAPTTPTGSTSDTATGDSAGGGGSAGGPAGVCAVLAAPVTAALIQNGITATPVSDGSSDGCRWEDQASNTTVTLKVGAGDAPSGTDTVDVPGLGKVTVVGPGELAFSAAGATYDLTVESPAADAADSQTAEKVAGTIGGVVESIGGGGSTGSGSGSGSTDDSDSADPSEGPTGS